MKQHHRCYPLQSLCGLFGYSRQTFYKQQRLQVMKQSSNALILQQVMHIRKEQPRCGTRKLLVMLQPFFKKQNIEIGRDAFFELLAQNKLLIRKRKRSTPLHAHELWVADITYIPMKQRFAYLYLITDAYSRKIVGFHVSDDMRVSSAIVALQKALDQKPADAIVIHHSDRGLQYCSNDYVTLLKTHHAQISMTQNGDPYENAMAERVNGILKSELISESYTDLKVAMQHIARCITVYNYKRVHSSINWQIPDKVHSQQGPQIKKWKNYYKTKKQKQQAMNEP
jgi:putative transposase